MGDKKTEFLKMNLTDMSKDGNELFNFDRDLNENFEILDNTFGNLPQGVPPSNCANLRIEKNGTSVQLKWKDPSDTVIENQTVCTWAKTLIVRKAGDYPANPSEGEIIATNTIRNQYNLTALADTLPDETNEYFYRAFPVSANNVVNLNGFNKFGQSEVYEFVIDQKNSNPAGCISYPEGSINEKFIPAKMDYASNVFDYGSWADAFFMQLFKPCMLKYDGTVDYYLDPNDYSKKLDGTASDVSNTAYGGNAMVEIGQIWIEEFLLNGKIHVRIGNKKFSDNADCYTHQKKDGSYCKNIYRGLFDGANVSNKIRTIAGQNMCKSVAGDTQIAYAKANGAGWNVDEYSLRRLINYLLLLIGKSTDTQSVFGTGRYTGYVNESNTNQINTTGTLKDKGMFYGDNNNGLVKVFHIENWWGNIWKITNGIIQKNGKLLYKMCEGTHDGSTVQDYNTTGDGYIDSGVTLPGTVSQLYIKRMELVPGLGLVPTADAGGTSTTFYCDGCWSNASLIGFARFGGNPADGFLVGAFAFTVTAVVSLSSWVYGVSLSYKSPL